MKLDRFFMVHAGFAGGLLMAFVSSTAIASSQQALPGSTPKALEILEKARFATAHSTYQAKIGRVTTSQKAYPDGTVARCLRSKLLWHIENVDGKFELYPQTKTAIKKEYHEGPLDIPCDDLSTFTVQNGQYRGVACYVVSQTVTDLNRAWDRYRNSFARNGLKIPRGGLRNEFDSRFPRYRQYYIGKENLFIYATVEYNPKGAKLITATWDDIQLDAELSDDLFKIPSNYRIAIARSIPETVQLGTALFDKENSVAVRRRSEPGLIRKTTRTVVAGVQKSGETILRNSRWIFGILAGLLLAFVIGLKVYNHMQKD